MTNKNKIAYRDHIARKKGFKNHKEYLDKLAKDKGFDNYLEYTNHRILEKGFKSKADYYNHLSQQRGFNNFREEYLFKKGFKNIDEYRRYLFKKKTGHDYVSSKTLLNEWAKGRGFANYKEFVDILSVVRGLPDMPNIIIDDRENQNFGGCLAEHGISMIFKNIKGTFFSNRGYDFVCEGLKIDVKSSVLRQDNHFVFMINKNDIADYFFLIGFNNTLDLTPLHFWAIKGKELIRGIPLQDRDRLSVPNNGYYAPDLQKFENSNKLEDLREIFIKYNKDSGIYDETITRTNILKKLKIPLETKVEEILDIAKAMQKQRRFRGRIPIYPPEECSR